MPDVLAQRAPLLIATAQSKDRENMETTNIQFRDLKKKGKETRFGDNKKV